jgi:hypothetical protein
MQSCREPEVAWLGEAASSLGTGARTRKEEPESKSKKAMREGRVGKPIFLRQHGENMRKRGKRTPFSQQYGCAVWQVKKDTRILNTTIYAF